MISPAIVVSVLAAIAATLIIAVLFEVFGRKRHTIVERLDDLYAGEESLSGKEDLKKAIHAQLVEQLSAVGGRFRRARDDGETIRRMLIQAGYSSGAVAVYTASRVVLSLGMGVLALMVTPFIDSRPTVLLGVLTYFLLMGWWLPRFWVKKRLSGRQYEVQRALPDAVDLMVVCVEAGLGLNQALVRVAREIAHVSPVLAQELKTTNLEIQAGTVREEAFRNFADRTGLKEVRALVTMLIQADRFGTSVAQALRVHSEALRTRRRQSAEEAAAKTTVKLVFPLVFFIFPALFVVILGPAALSIVEQMKLVQ